MSPTKNRFVLLCQNTLVSATVVAVAAPALTVGNLDIVAPSPGGAPAEGSVPDRTGALVTAEPVEPEVEEERVDGVEQRGLDALTANPRAQERAKDRLAALSAPEPVEGYATVGVTWEPGAVEDEGDITVSVRSLQAGEWSQWEEVAYHDEHGPDPDSAEARNARPGTEAVVVGDVDEVQVKAVTASGEVPQDMKLALIDPGETEKRIIEEPAIDTAKLTSAGFATDDTAVLTAGVTPKPRIYSRRQWGADERLRSGSPSYFEVHAGFVHHTVNANGYSRAQVPALLRGIYAYHTKSRGWSDVGYNFLVDRFGRIWEGRYGGVARPVVGAHTLGYNDYAFAMSAIGNFETAKPSSAMLDAYGRLMAWKLSLHGVDAGSRHQRVGSRVFRAINGHRDAGSTACPGRYLYERLGTIRNLAEKYQRPFTSRERDANISGRALPDLVARDARSKRAFLIRTDGGLDFGPRRRAATGWRNKDLIVAARDVTGDGLEDVVARDADTKVASVYRGTRNGTVGAPTETVRFRDVDQMAGVSDMNGDGKGDLVARDASSKHLYFYPGRDNGTFGRRSLMARNWYWSTLISGVGEMSGDGHRDLVVRDRSGRLFLKPGNGRGGLSGTIRIRGSWGRYDIISGLGDLNRDGKSDIVARDTSSKLTYIFPGDRRGGIRNYLGPYDNFRDVTFLATSGNVTGNSGVDLIGRGGGGNLVVFPSNGRKGVGSVVDTGRFFPSANLVLNIGDWNGDGHGDVMTRSGRTGRMYLYAGDGRSHLASAAYAGRRLGSVRMLTAVGDITGDGHPDLMGQPSGGAMRIYPGNGGRGFRSSYVAHSAIPGVEQVGVGLWNGDGSPDTVLRESDGDLVLREGNGPGGLMGGRRIGTGAGKYDALSGVGDADWDGRADIFARQRSTGDLWKLSGTSLTPRRFGVGFGRFDLIS